MARERESLWAASVPALIGLLGVLVGALITGGIAYLGDHNRRDDDKRAAVRLVVAEIQADEAALEAFQVYGYLRTPIRLAAWRSQQGTLARRLSDEEWNALATFYVDLETTDGTIEQQRCTPEDDRLFAAVTQIGGLDALEALGAKAEQRGRVRGVRACEPTR